MVTKSPRPGCEIDKHGNAVGRDPRIMSAEEFRALGHVPRPLTAVIRHRCLECCGYDPSEVAKCVATDCANWDYRMGTNPHRKPRTEKQQEASKRQGQRLHAQGALGHENAEAPMREMEAGKEGLLGAPTTALPHDIAGVRRAAGQSLDDGDVPTSAVETGKPGPST